MRILWSIHLYPPDHNCGAEYVAHHVNKYLVSKGHEVRVVLHQGDFKPYTFDGVDVFNSPASLDGYRWADVIITHLDFTRHSINMGFYAGRPVVNFIHNPHPYPEIKQAKDVQYCVYNSQWLADKLAYDCPSMVMYPPCPANYYSIIGDPVHNPYVTLINCNENKGGYILYRLAQAMPEQKFLAIKGSYDCGLREEIWAKLQTLPNVLCEDHSTNIQGIYQRTRVLLVLSREESWGRVATEAMSNGIPVIYTPTPGLCENVGSAGIVAPQRGPKYINEKTGERIFDDRDSYPLWHLKWYLQCLNNENNYTGWSKAGLARFEEIQTKSHEQLQQFEDILQSAKSNYISKRSFRSSIY